MKYRKFGNIDWEVSTLGFGCMRLPILDGDTSRIDEKEAARMLHYAVDRGVNYIDTAWPYHNEQSEPFLGRVLEKGIRQKVRVATKFPSFITESRDDFDTILNAQLKKLKTDTIDFYLIHAITAANWQKVLKHNILDEAQKALKEGKIQHLGFSYHDGFKLFKEVIDGFDGWEFCQIQYNYMDIDSQAGTKGLKYAAEKDLAVVVMEPLLGGRLVGPPPAVQTIMDSAPVNRTPVEWALGWLWNQSEISVVLSGMSTMDQTIDNVRVADMFETGCFSGEELAIVDKVREKYTELSPVPCTRCEYCMPCPQGVNISRCFANYNEGKMYNKPETARYLYQNFFPKDARADNCIQCGECEPKCPQSIPISDLMPEVHRVLGEDKPYK
jgi:uncharacterized protein